MAALASRSAKDYSFGASAFIFGAQSMLGVLRTAVVIGALLGAGCGLNPYQVADPTTIAGIGPKPSDITKSLRCEIVTYIVQNRLWSSLPDNLRQDQMCGKLGNWEHLNCGGSVIDSRGKLECDSSRVDSRECYSERIDILKQHPFARIDPKQLAAVILDFKNTNMFNMSLGYDNKTIPSKRPGKVGDFRDNHIGPGYSDTGTFELTQPFGINQGADLGPYRDATLIASNPAYQHDALKFSTIYALQESVDADFYCYKSLHESHSKTRYEAIDEIQKLVEGNEAWKKYENFTRIYVGLGQTTLAKWLQELTAEASINSHPYNDKTTESVFVGQYSYMFTLDVKPSIDYKYTLVSQFINPLVPDINGSIEHAASYAIFLNGANAQAILGAKTGNSCPKQEGGGARPEWCP